MFGWVLNWLSIGPHNFMIDAVLATVVSAGNSIDLPARPNEIGIASRFGDVGDKWIGGNLFCQPDTRVSPDKHQCAHRKYPCGTILIIENARNKNRSWCEVVDRGPYGANIFIEDTPVITESGKKAWYVKKRKKHLPPVDICPLGQCVGRWRGILDMSPAVNEDLGHNGFEKVRVYKIERVRRYLRLMNERDARRANESRI